MEIHSNKSSHLIGMIWKTIQTHPCTSCQLWLQRTKILTKSYIAFTDVTATRLNLFTGNLRPCYSAVSSEFIRRGIQNPELTSHFVIILFIQEHRLRSAFLCSDNIMIQLLYNNSIEELNGHEIWWSCWLRLRAHLISHAAFLYIITHL